MILIVEISIEDARKLGMDVLESNGITKETASVLTDHLVEAHCAGYTFAGLPRLLVLLDRLRAIPQEDLGRVDIVKESPSSAWIDGRGNLGYLTCQRAIELGIKKSVDSPIVTIAAYNSHYSGRLGYYTEQAARAGLVALHFSNAAPIVAPAGSTAPILGTNPICAAFPTSGEPVVCDLNTAAITRGEVDLAERLGVDLPPSVAIDSTGRPTTDPLAALAGAILPWGGHKGLALSVLIAGLGVLAGGDARPGTYGNWGYFFIFIRPDAFLPRDTYLARMDELADIVRSSTVDARMPGDRSRKARADSHAKGTVDIPEEVVEALRALVK